MKVIDKINNKLTELTEGEVFYSFEYFPPKTQTGVANLIDRIDRMSQLNPLFIDMTWGAGGRTSESTLFLSSYIQNYLNLDVLMHITCRCQSKESLDYALETAKKNNIKNLLVLRGDPPQGVEGYDWTKDYFHYAEDMIKYIREVYKDFFCIVVAGYPATHVDSKNKEDDLYYLKRKVDAGADLIITQLFYDPDEFLDFHKACSEYGITVPILPGILPVNNYNSFKKIIDLCKLKVPNDMIVEIESIKSDDEKIKEFGIKNTMKIITHLKNKGIKGFHLYTMNLEKSVTEIIERLGLRINKQSRKDLPFTPRTVGDKTVETVRPIFWSNNEKSYISKTWYWDEYPNGIWGDSRSPAFGNNEEHLHTFGDNLKIIKGASNDSLKKQMGTSFESLSDVSKMFISFLDKKIKRFPWAESRDLQEEIFYIKDLLYKMNLNGLFTINSQPAVNGVSSNDSVLGWGPSNGYVYQRMYLEFFISKNLISSLISILKQHSSLIYQAVNTCDIHYESFVNNTVCALTWGVFPNREIVQPTIYDSEVFKIWKEEAFGKFDEWISIYDKTKDNELKTVEFLTKMKEDIFLVTIVDNDYINPKLEQVINQFIESLNLA